MTNYDSPGDIMELTAPSGGVSSGDVVKVGSIVGVVIADAAEGEAMQAAVKGIFDNLACLSSDDISQGDPLYWDDGNSRFTLTSASGLVLCGVAAADSGSGTATVKVKLPGVAPVVVA
jgi:predicted RecA/RadA family phage recombinase